MIGTGLQLTCGRGEDIYNPPKARRTQHCLQRAKSDVTPSQSLEKQSHAAVREPENRTVADDTPIPVAEPAFEPAIPQLSNLERFLKSITPSVPARYLSKGQMTMRSRRTCGVEHKPYFMLGDLWESFEEWSAYGAGVPLILNDADCVVQYYVPYLSGIQIYCDSSNLSLKSRQPGEESDSDYRDSSSDGSSDCEPDRWLKYSRDEITLGMDRFSLRDQQTALQEGFFSDEGESTNSRGRLLFEYLERDVPYSREPLTDKISDLAFRFPMLKTLRSCNLLPSSWVSVAWYPIYGIPTGPTLKDLDACFLTYHYLHTPMGGQQGAPSPAVSYSSEIDGVPRMALPVFGLASYKFKGSLWTPTGGCEHQLANSLLQAADNWLRLLQVNHPDFLFFCRR